MAFKASKLVTIFAACAITSTALLSACPSWAKLPVPVKNILSSLDQVTVPVLLPDYLPFQQSKEFPIYFNTTINPSGYEVNFEFLQDCRQSTACFIGAISAERNGQIEELIDGADTSRVIQLRDGTKAQFVNSCGAYCTASVFWQSQGVLYTVTIKNGILEDLVQIADLAIQAGTRLQSGASPITARPIRFQGRTFEAQVQSSLTNERSSVYYVVKARAGQRMIINATIQNPASKLAPIVTVRSPSGNSLVNKSAKFDAGLKESGDYIIRVSLNSTRVDRKPYTFILKVSIR